MACDGFFERSPAACPRPIVQVLARSAFHHALGESSVRDDACMYAWQAW